MYPNRGCQDRRAILITVNVNKNGLIINNFFLEDLIKQKICMHKGWGTILGCYYRCIT